jgi:hypothetical protein
MPLLYSASSIFGLFQILNNAEKEFVASQLSGFKRA